MAKTIKPLYKASELKKTSNSKLWVTFKAGTTPTKNGVVYGSTLTRDEVRNDFAKRNNVMITDVRSRRVANLTTRRLQNTK